MEDQASVKNGTEDLPYIHHITGPPWEYYLKRGDVFPMLISQFIYE